MSERDAFMRAICENPDDDTPRLVFADWLQENGEEDRAEFIRVQVEAERLPLSSRSRQTFFLRERELMDVHEDQWRVGLPNSFYGQPFVRGFVEAAQIGQRSPGSRQELEELFHVAPLVDLSIYQLKDPGALATIPMMTRLHRLAIGLQDPTDESVERFLRATNLLGLESLTVFTSSPVGWNSPELPPAIVERFRSRFGSIFVDS